jgi:hypothetical protein
MKVTKSNSAVQEMREDTFRRSGQLVHDLTQFVTDLTRLETAAAELAERARTFVPAPPARDGLRITDPRVDTSNSVEILAVLKERLRRAAENFESASNLLEQGRETILRIVG